MNGEKEFPTTEVCDPKQTMKTMRYTYRNGKSHVTGLVFLLAGIYTSLPHVSVSTFS